MIEPKDVTIIIPHYGATAEAEYALDQCMISLKETTPDTMRKLIVVNGEKCHHNKKSWDFDLVMKDQGQCKAVNAAVAMTNTPWIFITNDDMIYPPDWFINFHPIGDLPLCMSPMLVEPRAGAPTFFTYFCGGAGGDFDKIKWINFAYEWRDINTLPYLRTGFNFPVLIRRDLWDTIGGYDINYDPWGSNGDSDLEYKIKLAGIQPYQNRDCVVYHFSQTSGTFEPRNDSYRHRNYAYFKEKWGFDRTDNGIWEASFKIPTKEEGRIYLPEWEGKYK